MNSNANGGFLSSTNAQKYAGKLDKIGEEEDIQSNRKNKNTKSMNKSNYGRDGWLMKQ